MRRCTSYATGDWNAAILLTRGVVECVAALWFLSDLVKKGIAAETSAVIDEKLMKLVTGHRNDTEFPQSFNVLTFIDKFDKRIAGFRESYDVLSEFAHPNWSGVYGIYCRQDNDKTVVTLGRKLELTDIPGTFGLRTFVASLRAFEIVYNDLSDRLPTFIAECEHLLEQNHGGPQ